MGEILIKHKDDPQIEEAQGHIENIHCTTVTAKRVIKKKKKGKP